MHDTCMGMHGLVLLIQGLDWSVSMAAQIVVVAQDDDAGLTQKHGLLWFHHFMHLNQLHT